MPFKKSILTITSLLTFLFLTSLICFSQGNNFGFDNPPAQGINTFISPGYCIGCIKIGESENNIIAILGKPENVSKEKLWYIYSYEKAYQLSVFINFNGQVTGIFTTNPVYKDQYDFGIGSRIEDVAGYYPDGKYTENSSFTHSRNGQGIIFTYDNGKVTGISVFKMFRRN